MNRITMALLGLAFLATPAGASNHFYFYDYSYFMCVGPGWATELYDGRVEIFWDSILGTPQKECRKACKAWNGQCQKVNKATGKCALSHVKSEVKVGKAICAASGGPKSFCNAFFADDSKTALDMIKGDISSQKDWCNAITDICVKTLCG